MTKPERDGPYVGDYVAGVFKPIKIRHGNTKYPERPQMPEPWTQRNDGDTTSFYSCAKCGASIQPMDRERHLGWHEEIKGIIKINQDGTRRR